MHLVIYRNDLRTYDHAGLDKALASGQPVIALFQACSKQWRQHELGNYKLGFIWRRLQALKLELKQLKIPLIISEEQTFSAANKALEKWLSNTQFEHLHYSCDYELNERRRDEQIKVLAHRYQVVPHEHHDSVIFAPDEVVKADGDMYQVFTPFKKQWLKQLNQNWPQCYAKPKPQSHAACQQAEAVAASYPLNEFSDPAKKYAQQLANWSAEQEAVLQQAACFCREQVADYQKQRDFPALEQTSRLSAAFSLGILSPRQVLNRLLLEQGDRVWQPDSGPAVWLSELVWREFYRHWVALNDTISMGQAVKAEYNNIKWRYNSADFKAWCDGQTGYPIVDAAMRQLNETGWMHNRLRMIAASFLVKDLQIDWRWGEAYFLQNLVDADFAANNGGWQWSASSGYDAAPYFRIFNPTTQSERFDPRGRFIRRFCPELAEVPDKYIHQPASYKSEFAGKTYPAEIVVHKEAREKTLKIYKDALNKTLK
ncbi:deoxyribodipyrimidine photo-lyase [Gayadomonas joobiniege]|uniref:deoxyribodipyrimidine photo-lyase n=1 Tax=Gayadomonas joobiniege TaxID=1234606 RepID=UPI0003644519|nr:deoxyribodipyrimidine photo-lyase [Gayadomonas joobiniege]